MTRYANTIGVNVPRILLPAQGTDFSKWAVVACDQFTSQPDYWEEAEAYIGGMPSTLSLILPEAYLGKPGEEERIERAKASMQEYLQTGVLEERKEGFVFVRRKAGGATRLGLVMALDLEEYCYEKGATTLIRATEGTIVDRIPPRLRIRAGAPIELPHILVLIDDPARTVIEPFAEETARMDLLYDTDLMCNGGHIAGYHVSDPAQIERAISALTALKDADAFAAKYGEGNAPLLFAMGDGNHSFATAKAAWEAVKSGLSLEEQADHPARYALVEIENVHDDGIVFEPIHRVLFGMEAEAAIVRLHALLAKANGQVRVVRFDEEALLEGYMRQCPESAHVLPFYCGENCGAFVVEGPAQQLCVGTLQNAIDVLMQECPGAEVDYIHGKDVVLALSAKPNALGFLLPAMKKSELFPTVVYDGALPRKTFSMGEANEKRYYMECRRIVK